MLVKDCSNKQVNLLSDLSTTEFYTATKSVYDKYPDHPFPVVGEDNWDSFSYLISKGTYAGSLIKRLAKWMKKEKGFSPDPKFIGEIGNAIGKTQSKNMESYLVTISNYFDWTPGTFNRNQSGGSSEVDSCFWKSRNCAREALREIYDAKSVIIMDKDGDNLARCWLISACNDDFMDYGGVGSSEHDVIFNAYGNMELYKIARILTYCGYSSYNKINFYSTDGYRMYINGDIGFALSISGEECNSSLRIDPRYDSYECKECDYTSINDIDVCPSCATHYLTCVVCGCHTHESNGVILEAGDFVCDDCFGDSYANCWNCGHIEEQEDMYQYQDRWYCSNCHTRIFRECSECGKSLPSGDMFDTSKGLICSQCFHNNYVRCNNCKLIIPKAEMVTIKRLNLRNIDFFTSTDYMQLELVTEDLCPQCKEEKLIPLSDTVYIYPIHLRYMKRQLKENRLLFVYKDNTGNFAFGLDFSFGDFGLVDSDGDGVYSILNSLIEKFKESSLVDYDNAFNRVVKYSDYMERV